MEKMFNIRFGKIRFGFWRVSFFKCENFGMDLLTPCALRLDIVYCLSTCVEISIRTRIPGIGNETGRLVKVDLCRK